MTALRNPLLKTGITVPPLPPEGPPAIHLWTLMFSRWSAWLDQLEPLLSPDERERAARFQFPEHGSLFTLGRGLLRCILSIYANTTAQELRLSYMEHGKPQLEAPAAGLQFNLSHSHDLFACAVTRSSTVGVDCEMLRPSPDMEKMARRFFSAREADELLSLPEPDRLEAFYRCWTRKEAYIKARGEGFSLPLDQFSVSLAAHEAPRLTWCTSPEECARWQVRSFEPAAGYVAALVSPFPEIPVHFLRC